MADFRDTVVADASRTARFAKFLRGAISIKTKPVLEVQKYPTVEWFSGMPTGLAEVRSPIFTPNWPAEDMRWLTVARVIEPKRQAAPDICAPWLVEVDLDDPSVPPSLNSSYAGKDEQGQPIDLAPTPEARSLWDRYASNDWAGWAVKAAIARRVKPLYQTLFAVHQQLQGNADGYDLFVGVGLFDSRADPSQRVRRHFFAFPAELTLDDKTGTITVGPSSDFVALKLETDFLSTANRAVLQPQADRLQEEITQLGPSLQDRAAVASLLTRLVTPLSAVAIYSDDLASSEATAGAVRVSYAPALILRPRSTRSLDELLARIEADASGSEPKVALEDTPFPWRKMMEDGQVWTGSVTGREGSSSTSDRVYFPLPANEEQCRIIRFANGSAGVVVQGPPGTGKSHTIANLISHYLAMGQRVLVTAQTAQALEVLHDKLPPDLQQLCVSLLGNSRASDKELQRSVNGILARQQDFDRERYRIKISALQDKLVASETRLHELERVLHQARAAETQELEPIQGYRGTRSQIAQRLNRERERFAWLTDPIRHVTPCPNYSHGWGRLAEYHRALDPETRIQLARECIALPFSREEATNVVTAIVQAKEAVLSSATTGDVPTLHASVNNVGLKAAEAWLSTLREIEALASNQDTVWVNEVRRGLLRNPLTWQSLRNESKEALAKLADDLVTHIVNVQVTGRTAAEARRDLSRLDAHYAAGGKRRVAVFFKPTVISETLWLEQSVSVEDVPVRTPADVRRARTALDGWAHLKAAWEVWARWPSEQAGSARAQTAALRHRTELLDRLLGAATAATALPSELREWLDAGLGGGSSAADLLRVINRRLSELDLAKARDARNTLAGHLRQAIGHRDVVPAIRDLAAALDAEDPAATSRAFAALSDECQRRKLHQSYVDFVEHVRASAPMLAAAIVAEEGTGSWAARFGEFEAAWTHRCARSWLDWVLSEERIEATHRAARDERQHAQDILAELTSARAWSAALQRIDDLRRASLVAWAKAVASIPATGLSIFRKRAAAQQLLGRCLDAIPAWVVSLGRLYETVDAKPGFFDVAIIDEASQCWLDSLVLFYLAKQVVIVGDDKQISPTMVGVSDTDIDRLGDVYLRDFDFRSSFTMNSSLFDHASRYLSNGVPLREHFRCVPEIIRFSNELCYTANPLIPLRQVGRNRLEPLKRTYLPDGIRTGDVNDTEARAIVDAIAQCHEDPAYDDAEFGVICLQGDKQGARIEQLLLERLGPAVFSQRRLRCGNPYVFQGDERDVMFISMVAAPNVQQQALTTAMYEQRFNVAMSRARDQAWLFHSIQEDELSPRCLRRRVLEFFRQPPDQTIHGVSLDIPALQLAAERADRQVERAPRPFDSWFEVDVALALVARGYTLSAQVEVANRKIDLVVEGNDGVRLAVECDGEFWHGADQYEADTVRQRQLERAEWTFARVRESLFYSEQARAIDEVVAACRGLDIHPGDGRAGAAKNEPSTSCETESGISEQVQDSDVAAFAGECESDVEDDDRFGAALERNTSPAGSQSLAHTSISAVSDGATRSGPFTGYTSKEYPDPRTSPQSNVREAVLDIVSLDGPLSKEAIYRLYRDGCPRVERAGKHLRQAVNRALHALERTGLTVSYDEGRRRLPEDLIIHLPTQAPARPRPAGARKLEDVPIAELVTLMKALRDARPASETERSALYREMARRFGVRRLMPGAIQRLRRAENVTFASGAESGQPL